MTAAGPHDEADLGHTVRLDLRARIRAVEADGQQAATTVEQQLLERLDHDLWDALASAQAL